MVNTPPPGSFPNGWQGQPVQQGEQGLTMNQMQTLAPDLFSPQGMKQVGNTINKAVQTKPELDSMFKMVAATHGLDPNTDFQSRIKQSDTVLRKVAKHRNDGKDEYGLKDVNDVFGGRFIAKTPTQKHEVIEAIKDMDKSDIKIVKKQDVHNGTYHAYHIDFEKDGVKGEIQVHDPGSLFEAVVNHDIRAKEGDKATPQEEQKKRAVEKLGYSLPQYQAQQVAQAIEKQRQGGI